MAAAHEPDTLDAPIPDADVFFGGVSSLADHLDRTVLVILRDGRHLIGTLASYDQFGSIVLEHTRMRRLLPPAPTADGRPGRVRFNDVEMGIYLVRGENVAVLGELDEAADASNPFLEEVSDEVVAAVKEEQAAAAAAAAVAGGAEAPHAPKRGDPTALEWGFEG